ncbi:MAG: hypothetical protein JW783_11190 [Bacteroidales bacterium]|nr:hypothetical protein [Bacteroidales bacterium]MBN2748372.1 hypothetical protein [Bacteroidales bacterium]
MDTINALLNFLKLAIVTTASQLTWLLGLLFIFGLLLYVLARFTRATFAQYIGPRFNIFFTGWIGTPVHELGHALFCIIFRHKIIDIKLYNPNANNGTLGYVNHAYNPNSTYQKIGNFFIGVGPIIFGAFVLYTAFYYLVPNVNDVFANIEIQIKWLTKGVKGDFSGILGSLWGTTLLTLKSLFRPENFSDFKFYIFLYLSLCIASHMELSPPDISGAWRGLLSLIIFFLVLNLFILGLEALGLNSHFGKWWSYVKIESYATGINKWVGLFGALLVFASIVSGINFAVSYLALSIYNIIRGKKPINPAW